MRNLTLNNRIVSASWAPASYEPSYESGMGFYFYILPENRNKYEDTKG